MINCIIIDDDPVSINLMKHFITSTEGLNFVEAFSNPIAGVNYIRKNAATTDLIFLDVEMPEMTGIEFLESFKELPPVILITSKEKYAVKAFEHKVIHFLVKPVEYGKFLKAVERVFKINEADNNQHLDYIFIKENGVLSKIMHKDIIYCEALGDYVKVHLKEKTHVVNSTMKNIEDKLKMNKQFMRVHRSYIINLNFLENFDAETSIVGGHIIPIGNKYKANLQARLNII
ncbi:MAG: response regulator transcription factor [Bacteroidetes bacterium]|nr:response regulator transcription factor [Bacteroidota bacterium]MBK9653104.1 response regulator transcription factor [Bacteroidota bacterium]MBL0051945.1 response regulator transcription factor [Bacteroidota bacterium]